MSAQRSTCAILIALLLAACTTPPQNTDNREDYWQQRPRTVVLISQPAPPQFNRRGNRKFINQVLSSNTESEVAIALGRINLMKRLEKLREQLSNTLKLRRVPHKWERQAFDSSTLSKRSGKADEGFTERDFSAARGNWTQAEFLLLIDLLESGSVRPYSGMVATGNPGGYAHIQVRLIELKNNRIVWKEEVLRERAVVGDWDTPPRYAALQTAMVKALKDACAVAQRAFSYPNAFR